MNIFIPIQIEMIQGDEAGQNILGAYDSQERADERIMDIAEATPYDPVLRYVYDTKTLTLNEPFDFDS